MGVQPDRDESEISPGVSSKQVRILVVDDEPLLCRMLSTMLKRAGYEVEVVMSGKAALHKAHELEPQLITLDVMMPDLSGIQVAEHLAADERTARIPIILLTALDRGVSLELRQLASRPGIYYLDKPFSRHQLLDQVQIALRGRA
jgi:CheY-like chemotaxis protein